MASDSHSYSWERRPARRRWTAGRLLRIAGLVLFLLALIGGTAAFTLFGIFKAKYEKIAESFDLGEVEKMEAASVIFDRNGNEMGKIFIQNRNPVPYNEISEWLVKAVIAAEDNRFYEHEGVDWTGVARAAFENWRQGRIAQGASTVTQQLARNSFEMRERTFERKFIEMFLARRIEKKFSKQQIMEMYLNRVYFGSGFYGADAAARGYFGKPASELTPGEAAVLAGLLRSPNSLSPWNNPKGSLAIRNVVLGQMRDMGFLTRKELREEQEKRLDTRPRSNPHRVSYANEMIRQQAIAALGFDEAMIGGFRIFTTLDADLQKVAEDALLSQLDRIERVEGYKHDTYAAFRERFSMIEKRIDKGDPNARLPSPAYLQGALLALENRTGGILAMVGGRDFRHSEFNRVLQGRRPAGTIFTPLVYAAAFENNIGPATVIDDGCIDNRFVMVGGETGILGEWGVERAENEYEGPMTARKALVKGKNAATVRLGLLLGVPKLREFCEKTGIRSPLRDYSNAYLGSSEMTLEELVFAFTIFPNQGRQTGRPFIVQRIESGEGRLIYEATPALQRVISGAAAFQTHVALEQNVTEGLGGLAFSRDGLAKVPVAGKNGTAYGFTDTYFIGYTSEVTTGVWIGFDKPTRIYRGAFGKDLAMPVWASFTNATLQRFPAQPFPRSLEVEAVEVCAVSGLMATPKCRAKTASGEVPTTYIEFLKPDQKPGVVCDVHAGGVRDYSKRFEQEEWPRAAPALDLTRIRPVAVLEPTLLGYNDVYQSVQPGSIRRTDGEIPVAKALPVEFSDGSKVETSAIGTTADGIPVAVALPVLPATAPAPTAGDAQTAQPASAVPTGFIPLERPALELEAPPPTNF